MNASRSQSCVPAIVKITETAPAVSVATSCKMEPVSSQLSSIKTVSDTIVPTAPSAGSDSIYLASPVRQLIPTALVSIILHLHARAAPMGCSPMAAPVKTIIIDDVYLLIYEIVV